MSEFAHKFAASCLLTTRADCRAGLITKWHWCTFPRGDRHQHFSGFVLIILRQFPHDPDRIFKQLVHGDEAWHSP